MTCSGVGTMSVSVGGQKSGKYRFTAPALVFWTFEDQRTSAARLEVKEPLETP